jgi:uncharacterized membrane-anchored protein YitT (DUF2179 family)
MSIKLEYVGQVESFITSIKIIVLRDFKPVNSSEYFSLIIPLFLFSLIVSLLDFSRFFSSFLFHTFISPVVVSSLKILPNQPHSQT